MSTIFPGMDPYLEDPRIWPGVHNSLIVYIRDQLRPLLRPRYIAAVEDRVYIEGPPREVIPDVWIRRAGPGEGGRAAAVLDADAPAVIRAGPIEVHETYIEILDRYSDQAVVTVIEVVSPSNKYAGAGRDAYLDKQREVLRSRAHLVEIDLLRGGPHVLAIPERLAMTLGGYASLTCVNRARGGREEFELYPRGLRDRLPRIRIPLAGDDPDVPLDLQAALAQTYEAGSYRDRLRYDAPCTPRLSPDDQVWADQLIRAAPPAEA